MCGTFRRILSHSPEPGASSEIHRTSLTQRVYRGLFCVLAAAALSGCLQRVEYQRPSVEVPADWDHVGAPDRKVGVPLPTEQHLQAAWWQAFQNEELTGLIERALEHNHDVRKAALRVLEGRALVVSAGAGRYPQLNVQGAYSRVQISENTVAGLGLAKARINPVGGNAAGADRTPAPDGFRSSVQGAGSSEGRSSPR